MSLEKLLNKLCTIQTKTKVQSATGSVSNTWANTYINVLVRYNRASAGRVSAGSYQVTLEDYIFYMKFDQTITKADRIVVDGKTFEVEHVFEDSSTHHLEVYAKEKTFN